MNMESIKSKYGQAVAKATREQLEELALALLAKDDCADPKTVVDAADYATAANLAHKALCDITRQGQAPTANTLRVRAAVGVDMDGDWNVVGWKDCTDKNAADHAIDTLGDLAHFVFIEADVPVPSIQAFNARVVEGGAQ